MFTRFATVQVVTSAYFRGVCTNHANSYHTGTSEETSQAGAHATSSGVAIFPKLGENCNFITLWELFINFSYYSLNYEMCFFLPIGDKPELNQLQKLICPSGKIVKVIESTAAGWMNLAIALKFKSNVIQIIQTDSLGVVNASISTLSRWMDGESQQPATWSVLIQALEDASFTVLANDLRREFGSSSQQADH